MYRDLRVAIVVPAHNEERLVGTRRRRPPRSSSTTSSSSTTPARTPPPRPRGAVDDPRLEVITCPRTRASAARSSHGHKRALELGADVCVVMAGDAQMDPAFLPAAARPDR